MKFADRELTEMGRNDIRKTRRHMQMIFQDPYASLNPRMTVGNIISEPLAIHGVGDSAGRKAVSYTHLDVYKRQMYEYDPEACAAHLEAAWDGVLPETGFRFQIGFNTGNTTRQTIAEILQAEFGAINPLYQVEVVGLPWPTLLRSVPNGRSGR